MEGQPDWPWPLAPELEALEAVQLILDALLQVRAWTFCDPSPFLYEQFLLLAIRLEIDGGNDAVADENGQGEIAEQTLLLGDVSLEAMFIVKEEVRSPALDDERIERRENVDHLRGGARGLDCLGTSPVFQL